MSDLITTVARAAANRLEAEVRPGLLAEVEAVLAARESPSEPHQYLDLTALASLIVGVTSLAWTVYTDLKNRTAKPSAEVLARIVRVNLRAQGQDPPDQIVEVVVTETIRAAADREHAEGGRGSDESRQSQINEPE